MCKKGTNTSATNYKSYLRSGVSLKALTKEQKEALVILKQLNKGSMGRVDCRCHCLSLHHVWLFVVGHDTQSLSTFFDVCAIHS